MSSKFMIFGSEKDKTTAINISKKLSIPLGEIDIKKINGSEIYVDLKSHVDHKVVFLIFTITQPINESIMYILQIVDTLKKNNVDKVHVFLPYLPYTKSPINLEYVTNTNLLARLFEIVDVDSIFTFDLYSPLIKNVFKVPIYDVSIIKIFSKVLDEHFINKDYIVTTIDYELQKKTKMIASYIHGNFITSENISTVKEPDFKVYDNINNKDILLVSNNIDTAKTIINFANYLTFKGARSISLIATHGLFSKNAIENIDKSVLKEVFVASSPKQNVSKKIKVISKQNLISEILERVLDQKNLKRFLS